MVQIELTTQDNNGILEMTNEQLIKENKTKEELIDVLYGENLELQKQLKTTLESNNKITNKMYDEIDSLNKELKTTKEDLQAEFNIRIKLRQERDNLKQQLDTIIESHKETSN